MIEARAGVTGPRQQYGVLPYRLRDGRLEVLLVTSRETRRWILPKGWPMKDRAPRESAAAEAFEEAGVEGEVGTEPVGGYRYLKRSPQGDSLCQVEVFPLRVTREHEQWLEQGQRERRWFTAEAAIESVGEPELKPLIEGFARSRRFDGGSGSSRHRSSSRRSRPRVSRPK